jgi:hypothetical protein
MAVTSPEVAEIPNGAANPMFTDARPVAGGVTVLKFHAMTQPIGMPALVAAVVIVAVYEVLGRRAADVVKVAIVFAVFMATVPGTIVPVPVVMSLSVNVLSAPGEAELIVAGSIARLKVAVINLLGATLVVLVVTNWLPFVGTVKVTVGIVGPAVVHTPPGMIAPGGAPGMAPAPPPPPKIGSLPPSPHPATKAASNNAMNHISGL